jgi:hypothetical protein
MRQKNSKPMPCHDMKHKSGNPRAHSSKTIKDGDAKKKMGKGTVKNIY